MIQFNLLPDVKIEYLKARRAKRFVMMSSALVTGVALAVLILLFIVVNGFQKQHLKNLTNDIARDSKAIKETPDLEKILTIQTQLTSLPDLHNKKPVASRLFEYVKQLTPADVKMAELEVDFTASSVTVTGVADSLATVNKFVDTLKFTEFKNGELQERAFYDVVSELGRDAQDTKYTLNFKFKPAIFESTNNVSLIIPNIVTTRSQTEKPGALFQPLVEPKPQEAQ